MSGEETITVVLTGFSVTNRQNKEFMFAVKDPGRQLIKRGVPLTITAPEVFDAIRARNGRNPYAIRITLQMEITYLES